MTTKLSPSSAEHHQSSSSVIIVHIMKRTRDEQNLCTSVRRQLEQSEPNRTIRLPLSSSSSVNIVEHRQPNIITVIIFEESSSCPKNEHRPALELNEKILFMLNEQILFIREDKNSRNSREWSISVLVGRCRGVMKMLTTSASTEWNRSNDYATTSWISTTEDSQRHYCYEEHYWRTLLLQRTYLLRYCAWMCMHINITA